MGIRTCAGRRLFGAPSVAVVEESTGDDDGGGEAEGGVTVAVLPVGVASQLPLVRPPGVRRFDDPTHPEGEAMRSTRRWLGAATLDVEIDQTAVGEASAYDGIVVAAIE